MFANLPLVEKIPHITPIIPVYFVIIEVFFTTSYYITFNSTTNFLSQTIGLLIFTPLAVLTVITHIKSMFTNPGYVPIPYKSTRPSMMNDAFHDEIFCKKCNNPRPPRAHHCRVCNKCTLKMDHHCPWIANCVGYYNQKNFYQFLFCATFGDLIAFVLLFFRLCVTDFNIKTYIPKYTLVSNPLQLVYYTWMPIQLFIGCVCALAMTISIGTLLKKQTEMLLNNQTTIEKKMFPNWEECPYYEMNKMKSFNMVMGDNINQWISLKFYGDDPFGYDKVRNYIDLADVEI